MTAHDGHGGHHDAGHAPIAGGQPLVHTVHILELLDNIAHVIVAAFFILMATTVIVHMGFIFARQLPLISNLTPTTVTNEAAPPSTTAPPTDKTTAGQPKNEGLMDKMSGGETHPAEAPTKVDEFVKNSLELLSNILFVVILLELLRTIITYLQTHDIQAIMQEFLVVGIISSVRKILLVGAESSLTGSKGWDFIQESTGVLIDIMGILVLIFGLVLLKRAFGDKAAAEAREA